MSAAEWTHLHPSLQARRGAIADHWYEAIAHTSFVPRRVAMVRDELRTLTDQVIDALLDEPVDRDRARAVGTALAALHYVHPDALDGTLDVLGRRLMDGLPPDQVQSLQPRLMTLLGALAAGFLARSRAMLLDEQDHIRRALFVSRQQIEAAEEARVAAEAAVRVRTEILNATAHDLRSPVTAIIGHADLLRIRLQRDTPPQPEWMLTQSAAIRAGALRINGMVEELLDVARLQTGQELELRLEPVDVGLVVQDVVRARTGAADTSAAVVVDAPTGLMVEGDRLRLERVVDNLLGNAIKYSTQGTPVTVTARLSADTVIVTVQDRGVGIPADEAPHLFTPFFRASTSHGIAGIGIGLAGAKAIVEQHGGRITVESVVGVGTTVAIALPAALTSAAE